MWGSAVFDYYRELMAYENQGMEQLFPEMLYDEHGDLEYVLEEGGCLTAYDVDGLNAATVRLDGETIEIEIEDLDPEYVEPVY